MLNRLRRELDGLARDPPFGISAWPTSDTDIHHLTAEIDGPTESPFAGGVFTISVALSSRYPLEPPTIKFVTPIFHPNIDTSGRVCLDTLVMPPRGQWTPALSLSAVLTTIRQLMAAPNANDALNAQVSAMYKRDVDAYRQRAAQMTRQFATAKRSRDGQTANDQTEAHDAAATDTETQHRSKRVRVESAAAAACDISSSDESD